MMTNKMLLTSVKDEGIPYDPFPEGEEFLEYPSEDTLLSPILGLIDEGFVESYPFGVLSGIKLPKNHCTIILGVTDELLSVYKDQYEKIPEQDEMYLNLDLSVGPTDEYGSTETVIYIYENFDVQNWNPSKQEVYVQIDFTTKKEYVFYPSYVIGPILAKYKLSNGNEITAYPKIYVRMSNEIHRHGPYNDGSTEPFIITIDNSSYTS